MEQIDAQTSKKPIDKEYLKYSLKGFDSEVLEKKYIKSDNESLHTHTNKEVLDKLSISDTGTLLYDGNEIGESTSTAGKSAYEIAVEYGFEGTEQEWLESLNGNNGTNGSDGKDGINGSDGKSAYEVAIENGFEGTESEWLASLKGETGDQGNTGSEGKSAYEIAVQNGFEGTELEWLNSLKGETGSIGEKGETGESGSDGLSAYQIAVNNGFEGTEIEWLASFVTPSQIWTGSNQFRFGVDASGNYGYYKAGADTVTPFKSGESESIDAVVCDTTNSKTFYPIWKDVFNTNDGYTFSPVTINKNQLLLFTDSPSTKIALVDFSGYFVGALYTNGYAGLVNYGAKAEIVVELHYTDGTVINDTVKWLNEPATTWFNVYGNQVMWQPSGTDNCTGEFIIGSIKDLEKIIYTVRIYSTRRYTGVSFAYTNCQFRLTIPRVIIN